MNRDQIDERLRAVDPAAELDKDPTGMTGQRLLARARQRGTAAVTIRPRTRPRRLVVASTAAAVMVATSVGALATGVFNPDPADVTTILDDADAIADLHIEGWRPELSAEGVWCVYDDGSQISTLASDFPLDQPLTVDALVAVCTDGNDLVRGMPSPPTDTTVCGATLTDEEVEQRLAAAGLASATVTDGGQRHRFPVVLGWRADCATVDLGDASTVHLSPLTSLDQINEVREIEIGLKAAASECLTQDEAFALAEEARDRLAAQWQVVDEAETDVRCHQVWLDPAAGFLIVTAIWWAETEG